MNLDASDRPFAADSGVSAPLTEQALGPLTLRPSAEGDVPALARIYGWHVENGTGTFELDVPDDAEMARRRADVVSKQLPWLVAERGGRLLGYAYANHFKPRRAYRFFVEDSIYLHPDARGQGIGRLLLVELLARLEARGIRQVLAVIGDSENAGSIGVHRSCGFEHVGVMKSAGWKFDRWRDVVMMQRALGPGDRTDPVEPA